jgi:general secretion pathway protein K
MRRFLHLARRRRGVVFQERGVALVLTLLVVVLLTAMILDFDFRTRLDVRAAGAFRDDTRAYLLAGSAVDAARAILAQDDASVDGLDETWASPLIQGVPVGDGTISVTITDESGKLDLNSLIDPSGKPDEARIAVYRRLLEQVVDTDETDVDELVDTVVDWIDEDFESRPQGAESNYYRSLDPPYDCRDSLLHGFDELGLVKGYTPDVMNRISKYVTAIWWGPSTAKSVGAARHDKININTAPAQLLNALDEEMDPETAGHIEDDRRPDPIRNVTTAELEKVHNVNVEIATRISPLLTVSTSYFLILATGKVGETERTVRATIRRGFGNKGGKPNQVIAWRVE